MIEDNIIQVEVKGGERWDNIALEVYGLASMMDKVINANPEIAIYDYVPAGTILNIPILPSNIDIKTDIERLPPWKR